MVQPGIRQICTVVGGRLSFLFFFYNPAPTPSQLPTSFFFIFVQLSVGNDELCGFRSARGHSRGGSD